MNFRAATQWSGPAVFHGVARQIGDASVSSLTTIEADVFDMDGNGATTWTVQDTATIHASRINSTISNSFDGTINVNGGFLSRLTVALNDPQDVWRMAGTMNLTGLPAITFAQHRLAGSAVELTGELNITHHVLISSPLMFESNSQTSFTTDTSQLRLDGPSVIDSAATFVGSGSLLNLSSEGMIIETGATLDSVGLSNGGLLEIGAASPGIAAVDHFENSADGVWQVDLGGYIAGTEHHLLLVTDGISSLAGNIEVELIDAGTGLFLPTIGDQFTIMTSLSEINGMFDTDPVSAAGGQLFHWTVNYNPQTVVLELANITVPEPRQATLLWLSLLAVIGRRRGVAPLATLGL